jgi:hypothetical protein
MKKIMLIIFIFCILLLGCRKSHNYEEVKKIKEAKLISINDDFKVYELRHNLKIVYIVVGNSGNVSITTR